MGHVKTHMQLKGNGGSRRGVLGVPYSSKGWRWDGAGGAACHMCKCKLVHGRHMRCIGIFRHVRGSIERAHRVNRLQRAGRVGILVEHAVVGLYSLQGGF